MCGIAGYFGTQPIAEHCLLNATQTMMRRGPDSQNIKNFSYLDAGEFINLIHTRLSIIDVDQRSNQPFNLGDKWITFNGEIYNYLELRNELESEGCQFKTHSDTEVLIHVLDKWGLEGIKKCEGMWAFALFDQSTRSLHLCRDRFGEKPLYYYQNNKGDVFFASEIKAIRALSENEFTLDVDHLYRFLVNGYKSIYKQPSCFFKGITSVPVGHFITFCFGKSAKPERYWAPQFVTNVDISYESAIKGAREKLIKSMEMRLRADVPLAFCMSGGVDSNSLISIASRELGCDVHGFTIVNSDGRYEENDLVRVAVDELNIKHTAIELETRDFLPKLRELVRYHDAPVYTITYYAHWLLQKAMAEQGYKISISGTAADELFSGYFDHHNFYLYDQKDKGELFEQSINNWKDKIGKIVRNPYLQDPEVFIKSPFERAHIFFDSKKFSELLINDWFEPFTEKIYRTDSLLKNRMLNEIFNETTPITLHEEDMNSMYYSIENRSPFLDRELFEFCNQIPSEHKVCNGVAKSVLREAMRGIVPSPILDSPRKVGFNAPITDLIDFDDPCIRRELLADSPIYEHVKREKIKYLLETKDLPNSKSKFLFSFLSSKIFLEENFA